ERGRNPFFARIWMFLAEHEPESIRQLREKNLAGLSGRVLEVGAGTGTNFVLYPTSVQDVVAVEPEPLLTAAARRSAATAPVPVSVTAGTVEEFEPSGQFDAVVCSLVLCSVEDLDGVLRQLFSLLRPGGQLRYLEHVASTGVRGRLQRAADATVWPRLFGNCHTHRATERAIENAGFVRQTSDRSLVFPSWVPVPSAEIALGRATRPV
ncbi:MAG: class I SAM-dependent methyltransferase, partial [Mycobacteriaceae bacterium]|nr:class I SAM-dependent methyltransferase [Mycobacteriaceae bacterium]